MDVGRARAFSTHGHHWFAGWPAVSPDVEACVAIQNDDAVGGGLGKRIETVADDTEDTTKCSVRTIKYHQYLNYISLP